MKNNEESQTSYVKPSRSDIIRSVTPSTALATSESSEKIVKSLDEQPKNLLICV